METNQSVHPDKFSNVKKEDISLIINVLILASVVIGVRYILTNQANIINNQNITNANLQNLMLYLAK